LVRLIEARARRGSVAPTEYLKLLYEAGFRSFLIASTARLARGLRSGAAV